jgi:hypothetical protein
MLPVNDFFRNEFILGDAVAETHAIVGKIDVRR